MKTINNLHGLMPACLLLLFASILSGCGSTAPQMVIAPELASNSAKLYLNKSAQFEVSDLRNQIHMIEIQKEGQAAQLINSGNSLESSLAQSFKQALLASGLTVSPQAENKVTLMINNAKVKVTQELMKYQATTLITLTLRVASNDKALTKTYNKKLTSNGVLKVDIAVLERDFNQQLSALLQQMINDNEIIQFIQ